MELSSLEKEKIKLRKYWLYSIVGHLSFFLLLLVWNLILPGHRELFTPSVQVDMVALPHEVKNIDQEVNTSLPVKNIPPPPTSTAKEETKAAEEETAPLLTPVKTKKPEKKIDAAKEAKSALEKLKAEIAKERNSKNKNRVEKRKVDWKKFEEAYRSAMQGNQASEGSSATGAAGATQNAYYGHIADRLRANWGLPAWLQSKGLRAAVVIYIDNNGILASYRFTAASGNDVFDDYVKAALQKSSPFAPPPSEMAHDLRNKGIEVSFPL